MTSSTNDRLQSAFLNWISIQRNNLKELLTVVDDGDVELLRQLAEKNIQHLIDYQQIKSSRDALCIYSSFWCTSLENSLFWMGGFRPTSYIRIAYSITGMGSELKMSKFVDGESSSSSSKCGDGECSCMQVKLIKDLHARAVSRENLISSRMANLQEGASIDPRLLIASNNNINHELECAFAAHGVAVSGIVIDADELRVTVLKELMHILTPYQGIRLLVASYKLHLSIHECGKK